MNKLERFLKGELNKEGWYMAFGTDSGTNSDEIQLLLKCIDDVRMDLSKAQVSLATLRKNLEQGLLV